MSTRLNPYISFGDNAREALTFYQRVLGGELTLNTFGDYGADHGHDADRLRQRFEGLSEGGTVETPLAKQLWGDEFGQLTDRFGIGWLVNISTTDS